MSQPPDGATMRAVITRPARAADIDAIVRLVESAYRGDASRGGWTTEADLLDGRRADAGMVRDLITDPAGSVLLLTDDDAVVGCCHLERRGERVYLGMFAVDPGRQSRGLGSALLDAAERAARDWGATRLELTVLNHRPELRAWYERRGFELTGVTVPFPAYTDERYGIPRRSDLVLQQMVKPVGSAAVDGADAAR